MTAERARVVLAEHLSRTGRASKTLDKVLSGERIVLHIEADEVISVMLDCASERERSIIEGAVAYIAGEQFRLSDRIAAAIRQLAPTQGDK